MPHLSSPCPAPNCPVPHLGIVTVARSYWSVATISIQMKSRCCCGHLIPPLGQILFCLALLCPAILCSAFLCSVILFSSLKCFPKSTLLAFVLFALPYSTHCTPRHSSTLLHSGRLVCGREGHYGRLGDVMFKGVVKIPYSSLATSMKCKSATSLYAHSRSGLNPLIRDPCQMSDPWHCWGEVARLYPVAFFPHLFFSPRRMDVHYRARSCLCVCVRVCFI